jgi:hypothetical protein
MGAFLLVLLSFVIIHFHESVVVDCPDIIDNITEITFKISKLLLNAFFKELCI